MNSILPSQYTNGSVWLEVAMAMPVILEMQKHISTNMFLLLRPCFDLCRRLLHNFFAAPLAAAGFTGIPSSVSAIVYDGKGNSVWFHQTGNSTKPASATRINFSGTADIIGGTGKFSRATGEVSLEGFFNPQDQQDASFWQNGWIRY